MRSRFLCFLLPMLALIGAPVIAQDVDGEEEIKQKILHPREGMETTKSGSTFFDLPEDAMTYRKGGMVLIERTEGYVARKTLELKDRIAKLEEEVSSLKAEIKEMKGIIENKAEKGPAKPAEETERTSTGMLLSR